MLSPEEGKILVGIARRAIADHLHEKQFERESYPGSALNRSQGVFVTLLQTRGGELRGCIGNPFPRMSLSRETARCAIEAATMDPRFEPVDDDEFSKSISVEVTVLSTLEDIVFRSPLDLPLNIKVGRDGLFVQSGRSKGLLLPQVAVDHGFEAEEFLNECCLKAGLTPDAWVTGRVRVSRFHAQIFSEEEPAGRVFERALGGIESKG